MPARFLSFESVTFSYDSQPEPVLRGFSAGFAAGWTGVIGANGAGKTTFLKLACRILPPRGGRIGGPEGAVYCPQRTDEAPASLAALLEAEDPEACRLKGRLGLEADWAGRWESLSHGERKRAQIAAALREKPSVLALDEPTNHIDAAARSRLVAALRDFPGIGLLVSHDRELLDALCRACLFLDPPEAVLRPGGYTAGRSEAEREEESRRSRKEQAKRQAARLRKEALRRTSRAREVERGLSKKGLAAKDHDAKGRIDLAIFTGMDGRSAQAARRMRDRAERAGRQADVLRVRKRYEMGIVLDGEPCRRDALFRLPGGVLPLGGGRALEYPDLIMRPGDRIALTGPNGGGKTTLIRRVLAGLDLPPGRLTYLPQEIDLESARGILAEARSRPSDELGRIMTVISRLGSRPAGLLGTEEPSPGELRKLLLALGLARTPHLVVMDEPTNHLDLPSIECLEEALAECPCGLLLVSHDERFLRRLTRTRWRIEGKRLEIL